METALFIVLAVIALGVGVIIVLRRRSSKRLKPGVKEKRDEDALMALVPDALIIGDPKRPLIQIAPCNEIDRTGSGLNVPSSITDALAPLVQRAPEVFRLGQEMASKTFRVIFSPEVTQALNDGSLALLKDTAGNMLPVVQRNGRFVENGRVLVQGGLKMANVAAMGWQIASIATAQHYLGEINEKLKSIENALADVLFLLTEEKRSRIRSYVDLLRQYHPVLTRGNLHPHEAAAIYQKLEDLEHECLSIGDLGQQMAKQKLIELQNIEVNSWFSRSSGAEQIKELIQANEKAMELVFLAHSCRVLGCQVKAALPGDRHLLLDRTQKAREEVRRAEDQFRKNRAQFTESINGLKRRENTLVAFNGYFDTDYYEELLQKYQTVELKADEICRSLEDQSVQAGAFSKQLDRMVDGGIAITVKVEPSGEITVLAAGPTNAY
jgi:hypothetical protein